MEYVLNTKKLVKSFGGIIATNNVSLKIARGARHALIGPNGAGKTTLINLITGVLPVTSGEIEFESQNITDVNPETRVKRGIVRTFQINQLFQSMTPTETLAMVLSQADNEFSWWTVMGDSESLCWRVEELLTQFQLMDVRHQKTQFLAYGKRRLLEMAIALACNPKLLLLDEPVAGVPIGERESMLKIVSDLPKDVAVLLIEHDMDIVFDFANFITVLVDGAILKEGSPETIANDLEVKAVYLGQSKISGYSEEASQ